MIGKRNGDTDPLFPLEGELTANIIAPALAKLLVNEVVSPRSNNGLTKAVPRSRLCRCRLSPVPLTSVRDAPQLVDRGARRIDGGCRNRVSRNGHLDGRQAGGKRNRIHPDGRGRRSVDRDGALRPPNPTCSRTSATERSITPAALLSAQRSRRARTSPTRSCTTRRWQ